MKKIIILLLVCVSCKVSFAQPKDPEKGMTQAEIDAYLKKMGMPAVQQKAKTNAGSISNANKKVSPQPKDKIVPIKKSTAYYNLSKPFRDNVLPNGLVLNVQQSAEQQSAFIAKVIYEGKENAGAAIVTAFRASGFFIRKNDGTVLQPMQGNMGIIISEREMLMTCKLIAEGYGVGFKLYLNSLLKRNLGIIETDDVMAQRIAKCMNEGKVHQDKGVKFFVNLLEKTHQLESQDNESSLFNFTGNGYRQTRLNALSFLLVSYKLMMDLYVTGTNGSTNNSSFQNLSSTSTYATAHGPNINHYLSSSSLKNMSFIADDCTSSIPDYAQDAGAASKTFLYGKIWERILEGFGPSSISETYGKFTSTAGSAATIIKFIVNYSLLNVKITGSNYLKRSRNKKDGETEKYTVNVSFDKSKVQDFNCFRATLNKLGVDFSVNNAGAVSGVKVSWRLIVRGGYTELNDAFAEDFGHNLLRSAKELFNTIQGDRVATENCKTPFANIESTNYASCISLTDADGNADINLVGKGLPVVLKPTENKPLFRAVGLVGYVQLKATDNLSKDNAIGTVGDILGAALPAAGGDATGAATAAGTEYGYRMTWFPSDPYIITLRDWDYCKNGYAIGNNALTCFMPRNNSDQSILPDFAKKTLAKYGITNMETQLGSFAIYDAGHIMITAAGIDESNGSIRHTVIIKLNAGRPGEYPWNTPNDKDVVLNEGKKAYLKGRQEWVVLSIQKLSNENFIEAYTLAETKIRFEDGPPGQDNIEIGDYTGTEGKVFIEKNDGKIIAGYYDGTMIKVTKGGGKSIVPIYGRFEANIMKHR